MKVTRYEAPVPVKGKSGRMPSELTQALTRAIDDAHSTGSNQRYDAQTQEEAERVAVRIRQIASKKHVSLSVAVVMIEDKHAVIFGPRENAPERVNDNGDATIADITNELRALLDRLDKLSR